MEKMKKKLYMIIVKSEKTPYLVNRENENPIKCVNGFWLLRKHENPQFRHVSDGRSLVGIYT